jgi:hypothetical protein
MPVLVAFAVVVVVLYDRCSACVSLLSAPAPAPAPAPASSSLSYLSCVCLLTARTDSKLAVRDCGEVERGGIEGYI